MAKLMNYLSFDNTLAAIKYYEEVFNATTYGVLPASQEMLDNMGIDKKSEDTVMHASIGILGNTINMSDNFYEKQEFTSAMTLLLDFNSEDENELLELDKLYNQVIAHDKTVVTMPLAMQAWGGKMGMLVDQHGINWMFHAQPYSKLEEFGEMK